MTSAAYSNGRREEVRETRHMLATAFGCSVVSCDPIMEGAAAALDRIGSDGLGSRALALLATGEQLPIRTGSVDAVVHADVMC